jgi:hypothetical protein
MDRDLTSIVYEQHDLVFLLGPHRARAMREAFKLHDVRVPLVVSHNSGVGRRDYSLYEVLCAADYTVVNNYGAWATYRSGTKEYRACNISNGVDTKLFHETVPFAERPLRAIWTGSRSKADDEFDVKGYNAILRQLERILPARGIEVDFRVIESDAFMSDEQMVEFYNSGQLLICASSSEGTPNICLEAAACGTAILSSPVGNIPEFVTHGVNGFIVRRYDTLGFWSEIQYQREKFSQAAAAMKPVIREWDWSKRAKWFYALFAAIIERGAENVEPFTYLKTTPEAVHADQLCRC